MAVAGYVDVYLALGSNQGERMHELRDAVRALVRAGVRVRRVSSVFESAYVGPGARQPAYLNAVVHAETCLAPLGLLECTQAIERAQGRAPGSHMQPRRLDIDVLAYGDVRVRHPRLVIPHPRAAERRFVLEPWHELGGLPETRLVRSLRAVRERQALTRIGPLDVGGSREPLAV